MKIIKFGIKTITEKEFNWIFDLTASVYEKEIIDELRHTYFMILREYSFDIVVEGFKKHMRDTHRGNSFPLPCDIVRTMGAKGLLFDGQDDDNVFESKHDE